MGQECVKFVTEEKKGVIDKLECVIEHLREMKFDEESIRAMSAEQLTNMLESLEELWCYSVKGVKRTVKRMKEMVNEMHAIINNFTGLN